MLRKKPNKAQEKNKKLPLRRTLSNTFLPEPKITNEGKEYVLPGDLYFENVSFRYPGAKDDTLKNISFQ
jgi:ABC-type multidrug transport system fused ATPase/permease subunit